MIDPEQIFRKAVYQALTGNLTVTTDGSGSLVEIFDGPVSDNSIDCYVILGSQSGNDTSTKSSFDTIVRLTLDIVCRQNYHANKEFVDDIAGQIEDILLPSRGTDGLVAQSGVQFCSLRRESANYIDLGISSTQTIMRKLLTYSVRVREL